MEPVFQIDAQSGVVTVRRPAATWRRAIWLSCLSAVYFALSAAILVWICGMWCNLWSSGLYWLCRLLFIPFALVAFVTLVIFLGSMHSCITEIAPYYAQLTLADRTLIVKHVLWRRRIELGEGFRIKINRHSASCTWGYSVRVLRRGRKERGFVLVPPHLVDDGWSETRSEALRIAKLLRDSLPVVSVDAKTWERL